MVPRTVWPGYSEKTPFFVKPLKFSNSLMSKMPKIATGSLRIPRNTIECMVTAWAVY